MVKEKSNLSEKKSTLVWYMVISAVFLLLTNASYLNYAFHATDEYRYTGANSYTGADKLVYMSMIEQGREGILFMKNLHTTEPQRGSMLSPHWFLIGQTARALHISNNASYQIYRVLGTLVFLTLLFSFVQKFFRQKRDILLSAFFILLSGGVGWFVLFLKPDILALETSRKLFEIPTDMYVTEGNTLLNFNQSPLFILSQLVILYLMYRFVRDRDLAVGWRDACDAFLFAVIVIIHPYDLPIIVVVLGAWTAWQMISTRSWKSARRFGILCVGAFVGLAYNFYALITEPVLSTWLSQNLVFSPPIQMYLWGYGLLVPLWGVGIYSIFKEKKKDPWWVLAGLWSGLTWILLYLPLDINRRFTNAFHIVLALVAYRGFRFIYHRIQRPVVRIMFSVSSIIILISSIGFFLFVSLYFSDTVYTIQHYYISRTEDAMIGYLRVHTSRTDAVLTSDELTSFKITSQLDRAVYRGHDHQTPEAELKQNDLDWFFYDSAAPNALARKENFVRSNKLRFIVIDQDELDEPVSWLTHAEFLDERFHQGSLFIYQVL